MLIRMEDDLKREPDIDQQPFGFLLGGTFLKKKLLIIFFCSFLFKHWVWSWCRGRAGLGQGISQEVISQRASRSKSISINRGRI